MVSSASEFRPVALYARRARECLVDSLNDDVCTWQMLGTNLSVLKGHDKHGNHLWETESSRLVPMDSDCFNELGLSVDDLIKAYIQTVSAVVAIDKMCKRLTHEYEVETFIDHEETEFVRHMVEISYRRGRFERIVGSPTVTREYITFEYRAFNVELFSELNDDRALVEEIWI
eukprot:Partr_v1_DN28312_c2_g1_i1_m79133 putative NA